MDQLLAQIRKCIVCEANLPFAPRPVLQASASSRILIIGQAPGMKVQQSGIPWDDASGNNLRRWLGVDKETFYDPKIFALVPMGFCYPGKGKSGDLPPRTECATLWHDRILQAMPEIQLTILIGQYAQKRYLGNLAISNLTETVKNFHEFLPAYLPLVHPSPRNDLWRRRNPWFETDVVPVLQELVQNILNERPSISNL